MKHLVVLTKSSMHKRIGGEMTFGACVVVFCPESRKLLRLTQEPSGGPLNGMCLRQVQVMDEIEAEITAETPASPQNENVLIPPEGIRKTGRSSLTIGEIRELYLPGRSGRFMDEPRSFLDTVEPFDHSVEIVRAERITLVWEPGKRRPKAFFTAGHQRHLYYRVTDPGYELDEPADEWREEVLTCADLVISIPNIPFEKDGKYYKFIAAVFPDFSLDDGRGSAQAPEEILAQYFGFLSFRPGQREVIDALLSGRDSLCVMPTGQGKSVCYQVPAMLLPGVTLVISPLISLMKDQVAAQIRMGIPAAYLNSTLSPSAQKRLMRDVAAGKYKLVYVSPEKLSQEIFLQFCRTIRLSLIAIDEAHCVSQWGPNFRYEYLNIRRFVENLPVRPVLGAFTATATPRVEEDICRRLGLVRPFSVRTGFDRPNLFFGVVQTNDRRGWVRQYLDAHPGKSGIIYCATRKETENLYHHLAGEGYEVGYYHAGLEPEERTLQQEAFSFDRKPVMIATNAFGMGIDKPNVSFVIHYNIPKCMESYYQEAGRAGRDGTEAECILLYSKYDLITNRKLIEMNIPSPDLTREEADRIRKGDLYRLKQMTEYAEGQMCLRSFILQYFGDKECPHECGNCSNCRGKSSRMDVQTETKMILSCVARTGQQYGKDFIAHILKGKGTARHTRLGMEKQSTWGLMKKYTLREINMIIDALIIQGYLVYSGGNYPVLMLTEKSREALFGNQPILIRKIDIIRKNPKRQEAARAPEGPDQELYELLRKRRNDAAEEEGIPPYVILDNKTLMQIAILRPQNEEEFMQVKGIGKVKTERYASLFIPIIHGIISGDLSGSKDG